MKKNINKCVCGGNKFENENTEPIIEDSVKKKPEVKSENLIQDTRKSFSELVSSSASVAGLSRTELNQRMEENILTNEDGSLSCYLCGKTSKGTMKKVNMKQHMETHMQGLVYNCPLCDKSFRSKNSYFVHRSNFHRRNK